MKLTQPIVVKEINKNLKLPLCIFKTAGDITSYIENFTKEEKEQYFNLKIDEIDPKGRGISFRELGFGNYLIVMKFQNYIITPYKITLSKKTDNPSELQIEKDILDFACRVVVGCSFPISIITDTTTIFNKSVSSVNDEPNSRRENKIIDDQTIGRIQRLLQILHGRNVNRNKVDLLKSLLYCNVTRPFGN